VISIHLEKVKRRLIRCEQCAGEAPPDLMPLEKPQRTTKKMQPVSVLIPGMVEALTRAKG
jgi:hypothetical protein